MTKHKIGRFQRIEKFAKKEEIGWGRFRLFSPLMLPASAKTGMYFFSYIKSRVS
ncbi:MAG: hypothetical protein ACLRWH_00835 [Emergencia sp.]|nr:hypothetical protein [Hungatella hathewayi]